jgi:hypothetical protein
VEEGELTVSESRSNSGGSISSTLLFIAFLVLKLTHVIDWSWWWVAAPLWIPLAMVLLIIVIGLVVAAF